MLARITIVIGIFAFLPLAQGQMVMGNSCPFPFEVSPNAVNPEDGKSLYQQRMDGAKKQMDAIDKQIAPIKKKVEQEEEAIRARIDGDAGESIIDAIEGNNVPDVDCRFDQPPSYTPPPSNQYNPYEGPVNANPEVPAGPGPHSSNQKLSVDRMPAADTPAGTTPAAPAATTSTGNNNNTSTAPVVASGQPASPPATSATPSQAAAPPAAAAQPASQPPAAAPQPPSTSAPSGAPAPPRGPPPDQPSYDGYGGSSGTEFCVQNGIDGRSHNFWAEWVSSDGEVSADACNDYVPGIQVPGSSNSVKIKSACIKALHSLKSDYAKLRDLKKKYDRSESEYEEFQDHASEQTEATTSWGNGTPSQGSANGMQQFMQFMNMLEMSSRGGVMGAPMGGPMMMGQHPMVEPMPTSIGGWPMPPSSQFAGYNYQSPVPGLMGNNFGCYGCVTGGVGQGGFGCAGMNNPMLYGNPYNNFGGPGAFRSPYGPWQAGAPFSPMIPPHPAYLPMPGQLSARPMPGSSPYMYAPGTAGMAGIAPGELPYLGAGAGAGILPTYTGAGSIYAGAGSLYGGVGGVGVGGLYGGAGAYGAGFSGNGYAPGSIRPPVGGGAIVGSGAYGAGYGLPGSAIPPILQTTPILGAGTTSATPPTQLPLGPYKSTP